MRRALGFFVVALALAAAGCNSPLPAFYTLAPIPGTPIERPLPPVALRDVVVAKYLDRPQIVSHRSEYQLALDDRERWAEPLDEMVPRVLVEDLAQRLPATRIALASSGMVPEAQRTLIVDIDRFDADPGGTVVLEARWSVRAGDTPATLQTARITAPAGSAHAADLVAAMSGALGQLADQLAKGLGGG